jgi:hypothetical protein
MEAFALLIYTVTYRPKTGRTQKGLTFGTRSRAKPEGINRTGNHGLKELHIGSERTFGRILGKTIGQEIMKRTVRSS